MARAEKCYLNRRFKVISISSLELSHTDYEKTIVTRSAQTSIYLADALI